MELLLGRIAMLLVLAYDLSGLVAHWDHNWVLFWLGCCALIIPLAYGLISSDEAWFNHLPQIYFGAYVLPFLYYTIGSARLMEQIRDGALIASGLASSPGVLPGTYRDYSNAGADHLVGSIMAPLCIHAVVWTLQRRS